MTTLHEYILCSDCYKVRLLLGLLGIAYRTVKVDVHPGRENRTPAFLALSPFGTLPVLEDEAVRLHDAEAILTYLALRHDPARAWLPPDAVRGAQVAMWLQFAGRDLAPLSALRDHAIRSTRGDTASLTAASQRALTVLEDHLAEREIEGRKWLVGDASTIADIAVFAPAALACDAGVEPACYPAVWRWTQRVKALPGFIVMPGVLPSLAAAPSAR